MPQWGKWGGRRVWVGAALAVVAVGVVNAIVTSGDSVSPTAEHCLTAAPLAPQRSVEFEREASIWLSVRGFLRHERAYGPLRPSFSDHSLVRGGTRRNEYSVTVYLYDDANTGRLGPLLGPIYVYGRLDPDTCAATITGANPG